MMQLQALCWVALFDLQVRNNSVLEITTQVYKKPITKSPLFGTSNPEHLRRPFVSINKRVAVIDWNCGWLATCTESKQSLQLTGLTSINCCRRPEHLAQRNVGRKAKARSLCPAAVSPRPQALRTNYRHTIIRAPPRSGKDSIVADASYAQYSFK